MAGRTCPQHESWDSLVRSCVKKPSTAQSSNFAETILNDLTTSTAEPSTAEAPAYHWQLWVSVIVVTCASLLSFFLWLAICQKWKKISSRTGDPQDPSSPAVQPACGVSEFKAASHPVSSETSLKFTNEVSLNGSFHLPQEDFDRSSANGVTEQSSVYLSNGARFQNIPFPATELGGAALVTTKTVQCTV